MTREEASKLKKGDIVLYYRGGIKRYGLVLGVSSSLRYINGEWGWSIDSGRVFGEVRSGSILAASCTLFAKKEVPVFTDEEYRKFFV